MIAIGVMEQLRERAYETGADVALVRGRGAPPRPARTVTVAPGVAASLGPVRKRGRLRVAVDGPSGPAVRRYDRSEVRAAVDRVAAVTADRGPRAVWLCDRDRIAARWSDDEVGRLERLLADALGEADAPLVVWTSERNEAVGDGYDVVLEA